MEFRCCSLKNLSVYEYIDPVRAAALFSRMCQSHRAYFQMLRDPIHFGKYLLLDRISVGGMAEVFLARSQWAQGTEKTLVIKKIHPTLAKNARFIDMFIDEARVATDARFDGIFVLRTSTSLHPLQAMQCYRDLQGVAGRGGRHLGLADRRRLVYCRRSTGRLWPHRQTLVVPPVVR